MLLMASSLIIVAGCERQNEDPQSPIIKTVTAELDSSEIRAADTSVGALINVPIEVIKINDFIHLATGLANTYLISTSEGNVLVDTGFAFRADNQYRLLRGIDDGPVTHIVIPQGQHDDIGGLKRWKDRGTKVIMTRATMNYMSWRREISPWLRGRFAVLYNWSTQLLSVQELLYPYKPIVPDIIVEEFEGQAGLTGT